jgi:hypothetical protein
LDFTRPTEILNGRSAINWLKVGFVGRSFPLPVAVCERIGCQNESSAVLGRSTAVVELPLTGFAPSYLSNAKHASREKKRRCSTLKATLNERANFTQCDSSDMTALRTSGPFPLFKTQRVWESSSCCPFPHFPQPLSSSYTFNSLPIILYPFYEP